MKSNKNQNKKQNKQNLNKIINDKLMSLKSAKWNSGASGVTAVPNTAQFFDSSSVAQGVTAITRVGAATMAKSLTINLTWVTGDATQLCRFVVFKWLVSSTSDTPTYTELFDNNGQAPLDTFLLYRPSRFKVLHDQLWSLDSLAHPMKAAKFKVKLNSRVEYDIGVNTGKNHIFCMYVSDSGVIPHPSINFNYQFKFIDLD